MDEQASAAILEEAAKPNTPPLPEHDTDSDSSADSWIGTQLRGTSHSEMRLRMRLVALQMFACDLERIADELNGVMRRLHEFAQEELTETHNQ